MRAAAERPIKVVYFDEAVAFGGSVVVLSHLFNSIDRSRYTPKLVTSLDEPSIKLLFREEDILHRFHAPLDYSSRAQWMQKIPTASPFIKKMWAYLFTLGAFFANAPEYIRLWWKTKQFAPDLVHSNNGREGPRFSKVLGVPMMWHLHGISKDFIKSAYRANEKDAKFVSISKYISAELISQGVGPERVFDIPNPAPLPAQFAHRAQWRSSRGIGADTVVFAHVGRLVRWKGQLEFLKAFRHVATATPNAVALIIGADAEKLNNNYPGELRQFVAENGLNDRVLFTGHVSNIVEVMSYCDVVVHSSIEPEPFGLVITEAMSVGAAVVAARLGAPIEIIDQGVTGFLVDPNDEREFSEALLRLAHDAELRRSLGRAALETVKQRYSPQAFARQIEVAYEKILSGAPAR